jgi:hypothetical protein
MGGPETVLRPRAVEARAVAADSIQLQPLLGDGETLAACHLGAARTEGGVLELLDLPAAGTDQVMMRPVGRIRVETRIGVAELALM